MKSMFYVALAACGFCAQATQTSNVKDGLLSSSFNFDFFSFNFITISFLVISKSP